MTKRLWRILLFCIAVWQVTGCKEPYEPQIESDPKGYLVVEGFINTNGPTSIKLSRTIKLAENGIKNELKATVRVEGENNTVFPLNEAGSGLYIAEKLNLLPGQKYRLRVKTSSGKEYLSEFEPVKATPPIDSVSWSRNNDGVTIHVNTHDENNDTRYYQWDYEETWEIRSSSVSLFYPERVGGGIIMHQRASTVELLNCWGNIKSSNILTASTVTLSRDVVDQYPLVFIPAGSEKLARRYSLLVRQYALSREAYEFLQLMKKNSEQMGSVFDPQPSQLRGNIRCVTDPDEPVIGYVIPASVLEKRIFIKNEEVPDWNYSLYCDEIYVVNRPDSLRKYFSDDAYIPTTVEWDSDSPMGGIKAYYASKAICVDCRLRGSSKKPDFWDNSN